MARRGDRLREHILWVAKDVFLEFGFERASMDVVASRAETSKRTLYAYFESKEKLFLAVIDLVRGLFLSRLRVPGDYSSQPIEALVMFCGRYLEVMLYREINTNDSRDYSGDHEVPGGSGAVFRCDILGGSHASTHLKITFGLSAAVSGGMAQKLLGEVLYLRLPRALFGIDQLGKSFDREALAPDFDLTPIRKAVADLIDSLQKH